MNDSDWMTIALTEAQKAFAAGEVPVGALIVRDDKVLAKAHNRRESMKSALAHAELLAIQSACKKLGGWRLTDCTLYVTLEPCPMCAGAILNAQIRRVVFGAKDEKMGAFGGFLDLREKKGLFRTEVEPGVREEESRALLQDFFRRLREA